MNIVFTDGHDMQITFGPNNYKSWRWNPTTGNLVLHRFCHRGCRLEIPKGNIRYVEIETTEHNDLS